MKTFDEFEKSVINKIVNDQGGNQTIHNLFEDYLEKTLITINTTNQTVDLKFEIKGSLPDEKEEYWIVYEKLPELQKQIFKTIQIIDYLEKNGFLTTFKFIEKPNTEHNLGKGDSNSESVTYAFPDDKTNELLIDYIIKYIIPSPDLKDFVNNKYSTKEDLRFKTQKKFTLAGLIISIVIGSFSFGFAVYNIYQNSNNEDTFTRQDFKSMENQHNSNQEEMLGRLDSINYNLQQIFIDTLSVSIKKRVR